MRLARCIGGLLACLAAQTDRVHVAAVLQAYRGSEPADARSTRFAVALQASDGAALHPMVYESRSPNVDLNNIHRGPVRTPYLPRAPALRARLCSRGSARGGVYTAGGSILWHRP